MGNNKLVTKIKQFFSDRKYILSFIKQFLIIVIVYGILFNFALNSLFYLTFNIQNILSLGFLSYFLKEEIPDVVKSCKI